MVDCTTRFADGTDAEALAHVHRWSRASYYGTAADPADGREQMWAELLAQPGSVTHVAEASGEVVGFVSLRRLPAPDSALELSALYVHPTHAGQGLGSLLHGLFERERRPDEPGVLEVWEGNERAIGFYRRRGWAPTSATRAGPQGIDFVTYRLPAEVGLQ